MDLGFVKKLDTKYVFRLFLYFSAACAAMILSNIVTSVGTFLIVPVISVIFTALLFSSIGLYAFIPMIVPITVIGAVSGLSPAISALMTVLFAGVIGYSIKRRIRPSFAVAFGACALVLTSVIYVVGYSIVITGSFSITEYFASLSDTFDSVALSIAKLINESGEFNFTLDASVYSTAMKSIFIGVYIAVELIISCIAYLMTLVVSRWVKDSIADFKEFSLFDIKPTMSTVLVYIISLIASPIMSSSAQVHFYTHLATNISLIISPIFFFAGIYYLARIKFAKEHGSPLLLIISIAAVLLFGLIPILPIYVTFCGVIYSIRYRFKKELTAPPDNSDERNL